MESFHEDGEGGLRTQSPVASFILPRIIDIPSVTQQNKSQPTASAVKQQATQLAETALSQPFLNPAPEHNQCPVYHYDEVTGFVTASVNEPPPLLPNQPNAFALGGALFRSTPAALHVTPPPNSLLETSGPLPMCSSSRSVRTSSAPPYSVSSIGSDSVSSPVEAVVPGMWNHALIVFDKLFCVCFVPPLLRPLRIGELVLCEFGSSDNTATVVADVSFLVAGVLAVREAAEHVFGFNSPKAAPTGATYRSSSPLYREKLACGLAADHLLCRLPSLIRRGTNRDKKRVYFSRLRSNDALAAVQHELLNVPVTAQAAEYQVNFSCATIYLAGDREQCVLPAQHFQDIGEALLEKLRCETVEFRFWGERHHGELDLTHTLLGNQYSEVLYEKVVEHLRSQSGRSALRAAAQANAAKQQPQQTQPPPSQQAATLALQHPQQLAAKAPSYQSSQGWSQPAAVPAITSVPTMTFLQQASGPAAPASLSYALAPPIYVTQQTPPQQRQQPPAIQVLSPQPSLSFVQLSTFPTIQHVNTANVTYVTRQPSATYYENTPQQQQQQQQTMLSLSPNPVSGSPVYYVVPSTTAVQWDRSPSTPQGLEQGSQHYLQQMQSSQPSAQTQIAPVLFRTSDDAVNQQTLPSSTAYVHASAMNAQGFQAVSYPLVLSPSCMSFQQFQC
ncbi:hypothetical protein ABB37_03969 [Leptomonas pyrrhocoris]|uniref:Uncharacterized protein n=1 Tax=Leptomonas pyrrhocoris TaxID=157538 RepID=A0A0N0DWC9_LEPPY|nr:hypothetical protein ABB37_03969 [Leptomonas pyrrhocoris]KPA81648.1 hypothetical protein ABB37_03969 [Leptomonas pyrrhocoris]|eukprot:XP_015660087.1 hypothetical protein ABB37_03969 [Leptomonas pyrrhocoris]